MLDLISLARAWVSEGKASLTDAALLRNLVEANMTPEDDSRCLTDDDLLSDTFVKYLPSDQA